MRDRVSFAGVTSFEHSRKEEEKKQKQKNYMKPVQTGLNRFKPVLYPDTSRKARHNRQY